MSVVSIRVNDDEKKMLDNASKLYGCNISSMIKRIVFEKLEDDYDLKIVKEYQNEKKKNTLKTRPIEELWKELDL